MRMWVGMLAGIIGMVGMGGSTVWALDVTHYQELKSLNVLTISKTPDGVVVVSTTHYDPQTGKMLPSTVEGVSVEALTEQKSALQAQIDQIDIILKDIQKL